MKVVFSLLKTTSVKSKMVKLNIDIHLYNDKYTKTIIMVKLNNNIPTIDFFLSLK